MKIKAKFKGSDSLGYVNGENYQLVFIVNHRVVYIMEYNKAKYIRGTRKDSLCCYENLRSFLNKWQVF